MKCPRITLIKEVKVSGQEVVGFGECIGKDCAWYDEVEQQCSEKTQAQCTRLIAKRLICIQVAR